MKILPRAESNREWASWWQALYRRPEG